MNIVSRRFLHNHGNIAAEGIPKLGLCLALNDLRRWIEWSSCPAADNNDAQFGFKIALDRLHYKVGVFSTILAAYVKIFGG